MGQVVKAEPKSIMMDMAARFGMEKAAFESTLKKTIMPSEATNEQIASFLIVAKEYDLNPFIKEIYAFASKHGGIQPIVSIDGWLKIINNHQQFDGMQLDEHFDDDHKLIAVTCHIFRKDRQHPTSITEYMAECKRETVQWNQMPARMLRHKATIQAARYAFSFSGIVDPDEAERIIEMGDVVPAKEATQEKLKGLTERLHDKVHTESTEIITEVAENKPKKEIEDGDKTGGSAAAPKGVAGKG